MIQKEMLCHQQKYTTTQWILMASWIALIFGVTIYNSLYLLKIIFRHSLKLYFFKPFSYQISSKVSAKAATRNINKTGAVLSPYLATKFWIISSIPVTILITTIKYLYILWISEQNFAWDLYISSVLINNSLPAISKALSRLKKATKVGRF